MHRHLKTAILRLFPELSGGLHLDRYARVLAVADSPDQGASSERFRPRLAVDIEILTPDMEPDPEFPTYTAVPLPVPMGAGGEAGIFAFPRPGALVVVGFAYGRQDHPIIRQIYGMGDSLPEVERGEMLLQQSPTVFQRADSAGNWIRETDEGIREKSASRTVEALESTTDLGRETRRISEHSSVEVDGAHSLEVGAQLSMLAGVRADLGALGALNLTAGADSTHTTAGTATETVGGSHISHVRQDRAITVAGARTETVARSQKTEIGQDQSLSVAGDASAEVGGSSTEKVEGDKTIRAANIALIAASSFTIKSETGGGVNLLSELQGALAQIKTALDILATHDHPDAGTINQGAGVAASADQVGRHRDTIESISA